ncbi:periplasmic heavy metal sensor [Thalassotalea sp. HSM 43]|uniref:Spy/CpxP family protein refolding chaperone n=1 Tax=Thalassotalea sp. HSM 43 TaxID=2552945 RepID=UPI001080C258|nr:Spy/CpxP family protein refolding chaperone [Thalassotalea sp. HSM 43]QBY04621.1 periplasmic heavy metal sensor [Thalassotalea sp. HSM 43]
MALVNKKTVIVSLLCMFVSVTAIAKPHNGQHRGMELGRFVEKLDLSEQQRTDIKAIQADAKQRYKALKDEQGESASGEQLAELMKQETFDQGKFEQLYDEKSAKKKQVALIRAQSMHQMYQLLNEQQRAELEQMMQKHKEKRKMRKQKHKQKRDSAEQ